MVFVHGLLVNADLWQYVVAEAAAAGARCLAVDWPLGAHRIAVPHADLSPVGVADLIADFLEVLGLENVTLVANDTGGALTQILLTRHPERVGRVVLTPSDSFERFFPPVFAPLPLLARVPGLAKVMLQTMRLRALQRLPFTFGWLTKRPLPAATVQGVVGARPDGQGRTSRPGALRPRGASPAHARRRRAPGGVRQTGPARVGRGGQALPDLPGAQAGGGAA